MPSGRGDPIHDHGACRTLTRLVTEHATSNSLGRPRTWRKRADIWRADDSAESVYFLKSGQVSIVGSGGAGRETILRLIDPGEVLGELCFCSQRRHNTARAITAAEALEVRYDDFLPWLAEEQDALHSFVFMFCSRLSEMEQRVEALAHRGAEQRLGTFLVQLARRRGRVSPDKSATLLHISHEELASLAAMSRSHVTVTMGRFRRLGLIRYGRDQPLRVDMRALEAYLAPHPSVDVGD